MITLNFNKMKRNLLILGVLLAASCSKKDADHEPPSVTITSPVNNQHLKIQDRLTVNAMVSDNMQVQSVTLSIFDSVFYNLQPSSATQLYEFSVNKKDYPLNWFNDIGINYQTIYKITVTATDNSGNQTAKNVTISINWFWGKRTFDKNVRLSNFKLRHYPFLANHSVSTNFNTTRSHIFNPSKN